MVAAPPTVFEFGDFRIDSSKRLLMRRDGQAIALTPKHFDTLLYLVENPGEVLEKDRIMSAIWPGLVVEENNLSQAISHLRRILGDDGAEHRYILTVPRRGYRFVAEVGPVQLEASSASGLPQAAAIAPTLLDHGATPDRAIRPRHRFLPAIAFTLVVAVAGIVAWRMPEKEAGTAKVKSIAVLPFANISGAKEDEFFSEGVTEDMVTQLAQISNLKVVSRTSSLGLKDSKKPLNEIARDLGVDHILQGSVQRGDGRFRINAQLVDPASDKHIWAKSYDRDIKDVLAVQSEVTAEIAAALKTRLLEPERQLLEKRARGNAEAYVLYLKGAFLMSIHPDRTLKDWDRGRQYFEKVIELDPASPLGYAGLARYHINTARYPHTVRSEAYAKAEAMARKALAADKDSVEANLMMSAIHARGYWDWKNGERFARRAVELNPGNAEVWNEYGFLILAPTGRLEEALVAQRRAVALDPLNMRMAQSLSEILMYLNRCEEAIQQARANLELDPRLRFQHIAIARCREMNRDYIAAIAAWRNVGQPWVPKNFLDELQALMESPAGRADPAATYWRARLAWSRKYEEAGYGRTYHTATFAAQAGETDEAFRYLNRAIDQRELTVFTLKVDPHFDPLRKDPRFAEALRRVNLE